MINTERTGWYTRWLCHLQRPWQTWDMGREKSYKVQYGVMKSSAFQDGWCHAPGMLGSNWLESSLLSKIWMSWWTARWPWSSKALAQQKIEKVGFSPLLSTGEAAVGVLCPVLRSSVEERHQHTAESPATGPQRLLQAERAGTVQPVEEKA